MFNYEYFETLMWFYALVTNQNDHAIYFLPDQFDVNMTKRLLNRWAYFVLEKKVPYTIVINEIWSKRKYYFVIGNKKCFWGALRV
jgi:hypothetical protein